jgi:hypothetical protein
MPTKVELMKELKETKEENKRNWLVAYTSIKKLADLEIHFNTLVDLIKGCDSEKKLDDLKNKVKHIEIIL